MGELRPIVSQHAEAYRAAQEAMLVDDVSAVIERVRFLEVAPYRLFNASLISELADASDRLAAKVAKLQEQESAGR